MNHKTKYHSFLLACMFFTCSTFAGIDTNADSCSIEVQHNNEFNEFVEEPIKKIIACNGDSLAHMSPEERNHFNKIIASLILLYSEDERLALYEKLKEKELIN